MLFKAFAILCLVRLLAACAPAATQAPAATEAPAAEPVKISLLGSPNQNDAVMIQALADAYTSLHPNVTFDIEVAAGGGAEADNLVKTRLATNEMNDIFYYNSGALLQALHPSDTLVGISKESFIANIAESFIPAVSQNEGVFGVLVGFAGGSGDFIFQINAASPSSRTVCPEPF